MPLGGSIGCLRSPRRKKRQWRTYFWTSGTYHWTPTPLHPTSWCFTGRSNQTYPQYHSACLTPQTASTQAIEVWNTQREQMKATTEVNHQGWSNIKQSCLWRNLRTRRPDGQVGRLFQWTDNDHTPWKTTQPEHNIPETGSISSQSLDMPPHQQLQKVLRKEGKNCASVPVEMPDTKVTASPPKPKPETPIKQKPDNPPDSVRPSRPRRIIKAPVKYGYD